MDTIGELSRVLGEPVRELVPVAGGDIHRAFRATTATGARLFVKAHPDLPPDLFAAEAAGLAWLAEADSGLRIPRVLGVGAHVLALEWLELAGDVDPVALGRGLAHLHRAGAPRFGYAGTSYLATLRQPDADVPDWPTFYVEHRLRPLVARAAFADPRAIDRALDRLRARADAFGPPEPPARLHGDLWWGNVARCGVVPAIFDPAVYGGHREIDLAMLALFGDVPAALIDAYAEVAPLADGWRARVALYQLYPLLVHAALFGGGYAARFARTLAAVTL